MQGLARDEPPGGQYCHKILLIFFRHQVFFNLGPLNLFAPATYNLYSVAREAKLLPRQKILKRNKPPFLLRQCEPGMSQYVCPYQRFPPPPAINLFFFGKFCQIWGP